jgi:hypothetical protein
MATSRLVQTTADTSLAIGNPPPLPCKPFFHCCVKKTTGKIRVKYWEIIADNLSKAGWSWGCVSTLDRCGRTIFVAAADRGDGQRFVVQADEKCNFWQRRPGNQMKTTERIPRVVGFRLQFSSLRRSRPLC